jgi:hypothetical protein
MRAKAFGDAAGSTFKSGRQPVTKLSATGSILEVGGLENP